MTPEEAYTLETKSLLERLIAAGFTIERVNNGGYSTRFPGVKANNKVGQPDNSDEAADMDAFIKECMACDEASIYIRNAEGKRLWIYMVYGNEPGETPADHTDVPELVEVMNAHYASYDF